MMRLKNKFGHSTHGLPTFYWEYRFDKISNHISHDEYLARRLKPGFYMAKIRQNAIDALKRQIDTVEDLLDRYSDNSYYVSEFTMVRNHYETKLAKILAS